MSSNYLHLKQFFFCMNYRRWSKWKFNNVKNHEKSRVLKSISGRKWANDRKESPRMTNLCFHNVSKKIKSRELFWWLHEHALSRLMLRFVVRTFFSSLFFVLALSWVFISQWRWDWKLCVLRKFFLFFSSANHKTQGLSFDRPRCVLRVS